MAMVRRPRSSRIVAPGIPPSRTRRFEPAPITVTGISVGSAARKAARSSASAGWNNTSAGPPTPNQVCLPIAAFAVNRPRTGGSRPIGTDDGGSYRAFGQKLVIERGRLVFGGPVRNPGLDLLALRKNQAVEAGVEVRGTLQLPVTRLVSEPPA